MITATVVCCAFAGCSRSTYRNWADSNAYYLLGTRQFDSRWDIPERPVEAHPTSRMAYFYDPDCGPLPPDDRAAMCYMRHPYNSRRNNHWDNFGQGGPIDSQEWLQYLPYDEDGNVLIDKQRTVDLALLHSREFQTQVESLYRNALGLSADRFEFEVNWAGGIDNDVTLPGADSAIRPGATGTSIGFGRNLATGGQFATNLANSFAWQLGGGGSNFAAGNLIVTLSQPLLRGAFRHVRTEGLTQAERSLLYEVRDFAHFRREFYLDSVSAYLDLLTQVQQIRIEEENVRNLRLNLDEHRDLLPMDQVTQIQVDQVFQQYQSGRRSLLNAQQALDSSLDRFKFQLGLPARLNIKLDETILEQFQLNSPELEELQNANVDLEQTLMQYLPPDPAPGIFLDETFVELQNKFEQMKTFRPVLKEDLDKWKAILDEAQPNGSTSADDRIEYEQQLELAVRIERQLQELDQEILKTADAIERLRVALAADTFDLGQPFNALEENNIRVDPGELQRPNQIDDLASLYFQDDPDDIRAWKVVQFLIGTRLADHISTLFVAQTQIRLFLIQIEPLDADPDLAVQIGLSNRLDLMNTRAQVTDAFRATEVAADALQSDLDLNASARLSTDPNRDNGFRFDNEESDYTVGVNFDGPLNRMSERNIYRNAQLNYQVARRTYMEVEDRITNDIRIDIRQLINNRFNFQISRQQLIAATRQVEQAQINLRTATAGDSSLTQDLLQALAGLRDAQNSLISNWL
ncbi:MAG: TolC family protein, partial [Planctomycetota bacterium]